MSSAPEVLKVFQLHLLQLLKPEWLIQLEF